MGYGILLLLIINTTIFFSSILKRRFEENLILTITSYIIILFVAGILGNLQIGVYAIVVLNIVGIFYNIYAITKKKISVKNQIFTFGFIVFFLSAILVLWYSIGRKVTEWDEFSHWALAVKNMFNLNNLGLGEQSTIICKNYLSGTSIFQFFCTSLLGEFNEGMLYVGMNLMIISTIVPTFKNIKSNRSIIPYICYAIMFFLPMFFYRTIYTSLYVDGLLALVFANTIYSYFSSKEEGLSKKTIIDLATNLALLVLIKDFGLVFAFGSLFIIIIDNLFVKNKFKIKNIWKNSYRLLYTTIPMILIKIVWIFTLKYNHVISVSDTSNIIPTFLSLIRGNLMPYQIETAKKYVVELFDTSLITVYSWPYVMCICLAIILAFIATRYSNRKKTIGISLTLCILGSIAYAVLLLVVPYLSMFSESEALRLASYSRYMNSYVLGLIFTELSIIINEISVENDKFEKFTLIFFAIFIITFPAEYIKELTVMARYHVRNTIENREEYNEFAETIKNHVKSNETVYFIATNTDGEDFYKARYEASPVELSNKWSIGYEPYSTNDIWTISLSKQEWKEALIAQYDYVYLYTVDKTFIKNYADIFVNEFSTISNNQLYKVIKNTNNERILELIQ